MDTYNDYDELLSVDPPTKGMALNVFIYLVPPYKPENVLMLGFGGGTTAGLIQMLYGDVPITAVDTVRYDSPYTVTFIQQDAREYVRNASQYDVVIVDVFPDGEDKVCDFVVTQEFVTDLMKIARYVIVNTIGDTDMSAYSVLKKRGENRPSGLRNKIFYYEVA